MIVKKIDLKISERNTKFKTVNVKTSIDAARFFRKLYKDDLEIYESFYIAMLDQKNNIIAYALISQGGVSGCVADVRIICKYAIETLCSSVILCHNHPSGDLTPSVSDIDLTNKIKNALELFNIRLLDSLILTADSFCTISNN